MDLPLKAEELLLQLFLIFALQIFNSVFLKKSQKQLNFILILSISLLKLINIIRTNFTFVKLSAEALLLLGLFNVLPLPSDSGIKLILIQTDCVDEMR